MTESSKRGSSRRKGDEYQDLTALRLALEHYIARTPFEMFLEYEKSGNLDDIVVFLGTEIVAYQVKYAVNPLDVYEASDLIDLGSPVCLKKFSDSWDTMRKRFPGYSLTACLCSNRALDAPLVDLVTPDGAFTPEVIEDRRRGNAKELRSTLASASGLDTDSFSEFLTAFQFRVRQPTLTELEQYIRTDLLDKELGLSDAAIFLDLKEAIKKNAIFSRDAITAESIDRLLERLQSKLLIPQVFPVNQDHFVEQKALSEQLDKVLPQVNGGYLVVTGLPGSGKSTSLTTYFDSINRAKCEVFSYYCFVGVNDNAQKMRVQAESLRANLLSEFHRRYPDILKRRYDYSERNFLESLNTLAEFFIKLGQKFVIFLDGLDHAERLQSEVRDTVISALPSVVPKGVAIVIGTQELHKWPHFLKLTMECPETHIQMQLFSETETQDYLENKRGITGLSRADIVEIHKKSEGLPLYLWYAAEIILSNAAVSDAIASLAPATGGDIRNYYGLLWEEFDRVGMADARHLCAVMACLRFSIHRDELRSIQQSLSRPQFEDAYKYMSHLLRNYDDRLAVFHNSFREFVIFQLHADWIQEIKTNIAAFLKTGKDSPRWFGYVFEYCYDAGDYTYALEEVTADFVDRALLHCRPPKEILDAIHWAIESAFKQRDVVQLSRLGALKFRTGERLEHNLDRALLADALLALGREQDVISFAYSPEANHWLVDSRVSLAVMSALANEDKLELGRKLFDVFTDEFRGIHSDNRDEIKSQVIGIARCLGIYAEKQARPLKWLFQFKLGPGILEQRDTYAPAYSPHLSAYIDALVQFRHTDKWLRLKRVKKLFQNRLVHYMLIRALAHHKLLDDLRVAVTEYVEQEHPSGNIELAFYAAKAGMPVSEVSAIAGPIEAPMKDCPDYLSRSDPSLMHYAYSFVILGYEGNESSYAKLCEFVGTSRAFWTSALRHLLKACNCIGQSFRSDANNWYGEACESIDMLLKAEQGDGERICDSIELIRDVLPFTIGLLTEAVLKRFPDRLDAWAEKLISLRDSLLWTTHFGISESIQDYTFELILWETLAKNSAVRSKLTSILRSCADTYERSTLLKGGARFEHFMRLAAIMAKCGMRNDAEKWLNYGIRASLIYGYHKDVTLLYLIDILRLVNRRQPERALEKCAHVLQMVKWMPHLTDGRETKWFAEKAFNEILAVNRQAAFELLKHFSRSVARWKMQDCLEEYLLNAVGGDPEYFWCLSESFSNHFSDDGRHCKQIIGTRQHIVDLVRESGSGDVRAFEDRFRNFVLTEISPRHWPDQLKDEFSITPDSNSENSSDVASGGHLPSTFLVDGESLTREAIAKKCRESFSEFLVILEKLKTQNEHFYERDLLDVTLRHHITEAHSPEDLIPIKDYVETQGRWQNANVIECLAQRFLEFGDQDKAIACYSLAYSCYGDWFRWRGSTKYLAAVAGRDRKAAETCLVKECYDSASGSGGGYDTPPIAATGLDVLDEPHLLEAIFNDFLTYCESMFTQLPQDNAYTWLKDYKGPTFDENQLILQFSVEELITPEIDHGKRLVGALARLAIARPESAIPVLVNRTLTASGRILCRLLMILHVLAAQNPELLASHQQLLAKLLDREDFLCRQSVLRILRYVSGVLPLVPSVASSIERIDRIYSDSIWHSTYMMPSSPSTTFLNFFKKNTLFDFSDKVRLIERILRVQSGDFVAAIEERLNTQNWSMDEERSRVKDDWYGHVHPQGWPVVWITTEFQELVTEVLWSVLNEAAEKLKLSDTQIHWLWQTIQLADPEFVVLGNMSRPIDILPLRVVDNDTWFAELDTIESFQVGKAGTEEQGTDWMTLFEKRRLAHEEKYNVPYRQEISLKATLIPLQVYGGSHRLDELELSTERIASASAISVTLEQARDELTRRGSDALEAGADCIPLIAEHQNPVTFLGYWSICTFTSFIIDDFNLSFEGFNLTKDGEIVAKYESWQEGYQDEAYTREKLSFGTRLIVQRDFLAEICRRYNKMACVRVDEKRECYKSIYERKPDEKVVSKRYMVYHF